MVDRQTFWEIPETGLVRGPDIRGDARLALPLPRVAYRKPHVAAAAERAALDAVANVDVWPGYQDDGDAEGKAVSRRRRSAVKSKAKARKPKHGATKAVAAADGAVAAASSDSDTPLVRRSDPVPISR